MLWLARAELEGPAVPSLKTNGRSSDSAIPSIGLLMSSPLTRATCVNVGRSRRVSAVAEMLEDPVDHAENDRDLERGSEHQTAHGPTARAPSGRRGHGATRQRIGCIEPPLDGCVSRGSGLTDDASSKRATGHGLRPPSAKLIESAPGRQPAVLRLLRSHGAAARNVRRHAAAYASAHDCELCSPGTRAAYRSEAQPMFFLGFFVGIAESGESQLRRFPPQKKKVYKSL